MPASLLPRTGWTITVDSTLGGFPASQAIDGNTGTFWHSDNGYPHHITIDMGSAQTFSFIQFLPRQDGTRTDPAGVEIYVSDDGVAWGSAIATATWAASAGATVIAFSAVTKRWFRFRSTSGANNAYLACAEIYAGTGTDTPGGHRYWRLLFATGASTGGSEVAIGELGLFDASGTSLVSVGTQTASSTFGSFSASKAFDGTTSTYWNCGASALAGAAQWLKYQFVALEAVAAFRVSLPDGVTNKSPTNFKLQYSDDDSAWTDATASLTPTWTGISAWTFPAIAPAAGDYLNWRVKITAVQTGPDDPALAELIMRTTVGGAQQATGGLAIASSAFGGNDAAKAFDGNAATLWSANEGDTGNGWIGYEMAVAKNIIEVSIQARNDSLWTQSPATFTVEASNSGSWAVIASFTASWSSAGQVQVFTVGVAPSAAVQPNMMVIT